jgi:hypothetical protein
MCEYTIPKKGNSKPLLMGVDRLIQMYESEAKFGNLGKKLPITLENKLSRFDREK